MHAPQVSLMNAPLIRMSFSVTIHSDHVALTENVNRFKVGVEFTLRFADRDASASRSRACFVTPAPSPRYRYRPLLGKPLVKAAQTRSKPGQIFDPFAFSTPFRNASRWCCRTSCWRACSADTMRFTSTSSPRAPRLRTSTAASTTSVRARGAEAFARGRQAAAARPLLASGRHLPHGFAGRRRRPPPCAPAAPPPAPRHARRAPAHAAGADAV